MNNISTQPFSANGKTYTPPAKPIVVICMDGSADEYLDTTMAHDRMPNLKKWLCKATEVWCVVHCRHLPM
ncbi:hypothetical protein [Pedobacter panaciterrae]